MNSVMMVGYTPATAVIAICVMISIIAAATWRNTKGEGWGLIVFLCALILGFNLSVTFAAWTLESLAAVFGGMGGWVTGASAVSSSLGQVTLIIACGVIAFVLTKVKFDVVRIAALGTLYGIILRLLSDFLFYWFG